MTQEDFPKFCQLWTAACRATSGGVKNTPTDEELLIEFGALAPLPLNAVRQAVITVKRFLKFRITAADVWECVHGGDAESRALVAWSLVRGDFKRYRRRDSVTCSDPIALWAIQQCGGWPVLCWMDVEKALPMFKAFYVAGVKQGISRGDVPDHLPGTDETDFPADWDGSIKQLSTRRPDPTLAMITAG